MFLYEMLKTDILHVKFIKSEGKAANSKPRRKE